MSKNILYSGLMMLMSLIPFVASADRFYVESDYLEPGKTNSLQFILDNSSQEVYGFQADVVLPQGVDPIIREDGELDITLSDRADGSGCSITSNTLSSGVIRMGTFSTNETPISGNTGVLVIMNVDVSPDFDGGTLEIDNILLIDKGHNDVPIDPFSVYVNSRVEVSEIILNTTNAELKVGETLTLVATVIPDNASDKFVTWASDNEGVASVNAYGEVTAITLGEAYITATCGAVSATCKVSVIPTPVESVILNRNELVLKEGDVETLVATVLPDNATDKSVTWTSSDESVASVSSSGEVTAIAAGFTTITASSADGPEASCSVTVAEKFIDATGVSLSTTNAELKVGETLTLVATVTPDDASDKSVTWASDNEGVASVNAYGEVTAITLGEATITATCGNVTASCMVSVIPTPIESVILNKDELVLKVGDVETLVATVLPDNATDKSVTWSSSDESVATVSSSGEVTAIAAGFTTITASSADGPEASCSVTVSEKFIDTTGVSLSTTNAELKVGETLTLVATVTPDDASDKSVTWSSDNEDVAIVDAEGTVTAISVGEVTITATCRDVYATCAVTVKPVLAESLSISPDSWEGEEGSSFNITAIILPENTTDKSLSWESSDDNIATVETDGTVNVLKDGMCIITVSTLDGSNLKAECYITGVAGIDQLFSNPDSRADLYNINGILLKRNCCMEDIKDLKPAIYILRYPNGKNTVFINH